MKPLLEMLKKESALLVDTLNEDISLFDIDHRVWNHLDKLKKIHQVLMTHNVAVQIVDVATELNMDPKIIEALKCGSFTDDIPST